MSEQLINRAIGERSKPIIEVLEEIINDPIHFTMTNSEEMHRVRQLALICRVLVEIIDIHQTEIARLITKLEAVQNK